MNTPKNFIPQTREEAVSEYARVAREYHSRGTKLTREVGRKMLAKARAVKAAADWKVVMFS